MKSTMVKNRKSAGAILLAAISTLAGASLSCAAPAAPRAAAAPAAAAPAPLGEGLASLDDTALAAEMSSRGMASLLDYYFQVNHTSDAQRAAIKTFGALRELRNNPNIRPVEKMQRVKQVAEGIDILLPSLKDPMEMMNTAASIVEFGVNPDMNDIEYWGEDPITQSSLKPLADAVVKLADAASASARKQADALQAIIKGGNDPNADRWDALDKLSALATYTRQMSVYFAASARTAKDPERNKLANDGIKALSEYDNDQFGVQPRVRNMIAKLEMVSGDYAKAKQTLATVIAGKDEAGKDLVPLATPYELNEARRFVVLSDLLSKDLAAAKKDEADLQTWQANEMPKLLEALKVPADAIAAGVKANAAGAMMLDWRIQVLEGDLAKTSAEKAKAEDAAEAVLGKLRQAHPEMGARIDQQLVKRMPADKKIDDKMEPSLLIALEKKGLSETMKPAEEKADVVVVRKGIESAQAIVKRKAGVGLAPNEVEDAELAIAQLHNYLGDRVEAANAFIDYAVAYYPTNPNKANQSIQAAGYLVMGVMRKMPTPPTGFAEVYNRFLPIAINPPYNHTDLAYSWAEQLRGLKRYTDALRYYRMVPRTDVQVYPLAKYKEMLCLEGLLDTKQEPTLHQQTVLEAVQVGEEVKKLCDPPKDEHDRNHALEAMGLLADLYRIEKKDPNMALQALDGFEKLVAGLTDPEVRAARTRGVIATRINAYLALGKSNEAVQQVTELLQTAKGDEGINFVKVLLAKLNKDYATAESAHDVAKMKDAARNTALLTGYLVKYSDPSTQKDPKVSEYYYAYCVYDATAQRIAGSLVEDPAEKTRLLQAAADRFKFLLSDAMHKLYVAQPEVKKRIAQGLSPEDPDWQAQTGQALADFELGNYKDARDLLNPIIALKKLGTGDIETVDPANGQVSIKPNDLYWEAYYKLLKSDYEVGKTDAQAKDEGIKLLKNILLLGGIPDRRQEDFENLRKEAIPDFDPNKAVTAPKAAPAPAPAAHAAK